jgi:hypothetical protein
MGLIFVRAVFPDGSAAVQQADRLSSGGPRGWGCLQTARGIGSAGCGVLSTVCDATVSRQQSGAGMRGAKMAWQRAQLEQ